MKYSLLLALALAVPAQAATTLFEQAFNSADPGTTDLDTTNPSGGTLNATAWVAAPAFKTNGTYGGTGSATLALTPAQGMVYTLDLSIASATGGSWVAFGFAKGQSTSATSTNRFTSETDVLVEGRAWGIVRSTGLTSNNQTFLKGTSGAPAAGLDWSALTTLDAPVDVRVVLDTTLGDNLWTTTMYARTGSNPYSIIRAESSLGVNDDVNSVGFATSGATASVSYFKVSVVPEPSSLMLLGLAGGACMLRRRRI